MSRNAYLISDKPASSSEAIIPIFSNAVTGRFSCEQGKKYQVVDPVATAQEEQPPSVPSVIPAAATTVSQTPGLLSHWQRSGGLSPAMGAARFMQTATSVRTSSRKRQRTAAPEPVEHLALKQISLVNIDLSDDQKRMKVTGQPIQTSNVQLKEGEVSVPAITSAVQDCFKNAGIIDGPEGIVLVDKDAAVLLDEPATRRKLLGRTSDDA